MRFLYKIHSSYDGFRPSVLPQRLKNRRLRLGWRHYIDVVEKGWECWVYFHGPHSFENGVYAKGIVDRIYLDANEVSLRVRDYKTEVPITSQETSARVADVVATRYRQVFLWPDDWTETPHCGLMACKGRRCEDCETWAKLPLVGNGESKMPSRLQGIESKYVVPGHWIVPSRCYEKNIGAGVRNLTRRFTDFKLGEMAYAFPFALSIFEQLRRRELLDFDYVVPIPLSPDKVEMGEKHRTLELAKELGRLLAVEVHEMIKLSSSVSKRRMKAQGYTVAQFERQYRQALEAQIPPNASRILLVDDVMTRGSTAAQALHAIRKQRPEASVVVATAGQMIVKEAVARDRGFKPS